MRKSIVVITLLLAHGSLVFARAAIWERRRSRKPAREMLPAFVESNWVMTERCSSVFSKIEPKLSSACQKVFQSHGM